ELDAELNKLIGDRTIKLWDAQTGQLKQTLQCEGVIHQARFLPDGATLIATHSNAIKSEDLTEATGFTVWDAQTGKAVRTIKADPQASFLLLPEGALVISRGTEAEEVKAWDPRTGELKWKNSEVWVSIFDDAPFTPDGKLLVTQTKYLDLNPAVKLLDAQTGQVRWSLPGGGRTSFSPDGQTLACLNAAQVSFWNLGTGKLKWSIATLNTKSPQTPFLANGNLVAVYGQHYAIELRGASDGKLLVSLLALPGVGQANEKGETAPEWIAFTPEGYYSASPGATRYIRWRVGDKLLPAESYAKEFNRPDLVIKAIREGQ
ncbi:MAG: PQQ-binding-like beta-propeller repeat protein, partial [Acidobacteriota bacterium]|nr:PQQ-binding-like beta-propeller repeat protein [Acidobacteriota bacterium]